jgi:hypothetical protein
MDVFKFLSICNKSLDGVKESSRVYENASCKESFQGIIIESYYSIFCSSITTPFGLFHMRKGGSGDTNPAIEAYIKSRITYKMIIPLDQCVKTGCIGPFYLVTHIDGVPIEHGNVDGITLNTYYKYVQRNSGRPEAFAVMIQDYMKDGLIHDKGGYINKLLANPCVYPDIVEELLVGLEYAQYNRKMNSNIYFHLFCLLDQKKLLIF